MAAVCSSMDLRVVRMVQNCRAGGRICCVLGSSSHHVVSTSLGGAYTDDRSESSSCPLGALAFGGLPVRFLGVAGAETELPG